MLRFEVEHGAGQLAGSLFHSVYCFFSSHVVCRQFYCHHFLIFCSSRITSVLYVVERLFV